MYLDDAIKFFKANVFFKEFVPENDADRLFIYITLWIQGTTMMTHRHDSYFISECLKVLAKVSSQDEGWKQLYSACVQDFAIPGDSRFPLNSYFHKPTSSSDAQRMKDYLKVCIIMSHNLLLIL